jgi:hypothetical protein
MMEGCLGMMDSLNRDEPASWSLDGILVINPGISSIAGESIEQQLQPLGLAHEFIHSYDVADLTPRLRRYLRANCSVGQRSCAQASSGVASRCRTPMAACADPEDDALLAINLFLGSRRRSRICVHALRVLHRQWGTSIPSDAGPGPAFYLQTLGKAYVLGSHVSNGVEWIEAQWDPLPIDNLFEQIDRNGIDLYWLRAWIINRGERRFQSVLSLRLPSRSADHCGSAEIRRKVSLLIGPRSRAGRY